MQTKYYLTFEQVGVIRRIPIKEQDPDMQGILDAFTEAFRIANEMSDDDKVNTIDLINALQHCDTIYIDTVEIYEEGFEMIEQKVPLGDAGQCVRTLIQIIRFNYCKNWDIIRNNPSSIHNYFNGCMDIIMSFIDEDCLVTVSNIIERWAEEIQEKLLTLKNNRDEQI